MGYASSKHVTQSGQVSRSVFGVEEGDALPPSLSLTTTMGSSNVLGGARYGTSTNKSSVVTSSSSNATQTLGNASATLRTSSSSGSNRSSAELKRLADESLRNLQETRSLNRTEAQEESQAGQVRQLARDQAARGAVSSSTTTHTTTTRTSNTSQQQQQQARTQQNVRQGASSSTSRGRGLPRSALDDLEVTVDSDSALWAFETGDGF